jgi:hypothetical protein
MKSTATGCRGVKSWRIAHFTVSLVVGNAPRREIARVSFGVRVDSLDRVTCDTPAATPAQRELPFDR